MAKTSTNGTAAPATARDTSTCTVLLTGVGGIVGQGILKCLADSPYRTIGIDASALAAGLYASDRGFLVPRVEDPSYFDFLLDLCKREKVRYIFAGLDLELPA